MPEKTKATLRSKKSKKKEKHLSREDRNLSKEKDKKTETDSKVVGFKFVEKKTTEQIKNTVLENIVKMLMVRKQLKGYDVEFKKIENKEKFEKYKTEIFKNVSKSDNIHLISADPVIPDNIAKVEESYRDYAIMYYPSNLQSVNIQPITNFMQTYKDKNKILVVKEFTQNPYDEYSKNPFTQILQEHELLICLYETVFEPVARAITDSKEIEKIKKELNLTGRQSLQLLSGDPLARFFGLKIGDFLQVHRAGSNVVSTPSWREVVKGTIDL